MNMADDGSTDTGAARLADGLQRREVLTLAAAGPWMLGGSTRAQAQASTGKTLRVYRRGQFKSLDPARGFEENSIDLIELSYSTLLRYAWLERPYKLEPDLLERMPEAGADKLTLQFTLRQGIRFHDDPCFPGGKGRELTSDDVLATLRRFADANINTQSWFLLDGMVEGLDAFREATRKAGPRGDVSKLEIPGFKRIDSHRFSIRLVRESALFLYAWGSPALSIIAPEAVRHYGEQFDVHPVGTGPFVLRQLERKGTMRYQRHAGYHGRYPTVGEAGDREAGLLQSAGQPLPRVEQLELPLIEEPQPAALRFQKGELDYLNLDRASFDRMVRREGGRFVLAPEFAGRFELAQAPSLGTILLWINHKDPLLGRNKPLRQALARLLDVQGDIDTLLGGRARPLASPVPHAIAGSDADTGARPVGFDPEAAKRLLAQAGFPEGKGLPELTLSCGFGGTDWRNRVDFHRTRLAAAGLRIKPQFSDLPTFQRALEGSNFQLALYGWVADYPDAENFFQLFYSKNAAPGSNASSFSSAAYDKAYEAARFMAHGPERLQHFRTLVGIIQDEWPAIPLYNGVGVSLRQPGLRNYKRHALTLGLAYLDKAG